MMRFKKYLHVNIRMTVLVGFVFFVVALFTLPDYGINWDTINHLPRGQAYLHFFLTGEKDYLSLPGFFKGWQKEGQWYWQDPDKLSIKTDLPANNVPERSLYQNDSVTFSYYVENDSGHPPLSDILSSLFNIVFFRELKLVNDIDSYRLYGVLLSSMLIALIFYWVTSLYGKFAGFIASLSLSLYPLFWAESHFNTEKDIPETVYWSLFLFAFWSSITKKSWKWAIFSGVAFGFALGTKFNILFVPFVILPWFLIYVFGDGRASKKIKDILKKKLLVLSLTLIPIIGILIFFGSWPYTWADIIDRSTKIFGFYREIGTVNALDQRFASLFGMGTFPSQWILYTTPIVILFLSTVGTIAALFNLKSDKNKTALLFIVWLVVPILRVSWPGSNVYGGARQFMEYIPAMAILSGLGAFYIKKYSEKLIYKRPMLKICCPLLLVIAFVPIFLKLHEIHPNENVYFNSIVGGLSGAKERSIPFWGFSFGSPYRRIASWINKNIEKGATLAYSYDLIPNLPRIWLRQDINLHNANRSGYFLDGEYAMGLIYDGTSERSYYEMYLDTLLNPVFEILVDGVPIAKVWKNDKKYLKIPINEYIVKGSTLVNNETGLLFDLKKEVYIYRLEIEYSEAACRPLNFGYTNISRDGTNWTSIPGVFPDDWGIPKFGMQPEKGHFFQPFVGQKTRYVNLVLSPNNSCLSQIRNFKIYALRK